MYISKSFATLPAYYKSKPSYFWRSNNPKSPIGIKLSDNLNAWIPF